MTRRIDPCPCGSGKRFKHCHGRIEPMGARAIPPEIMQQVNEIKAKQKIQEQQQGLGRPIVSFESNGYRIVAVGVTIHTGKWKTFHEFLIYYLPHVLGKEWGDQERAKPVENQHPVFQWHEALAKYLRENVVSPGGINNAPMIGVVDAYLQLSYNLYLLQHNEELQTRLIDRLKNLESFPGAYYETNVFGALIKAGFELKFEDESDGTTTHCECVATHKVTGKKFSVEAKAIRREGALGAVENTTKKNLPSSVRNQLQRALKKKAPHPRIVFIDVNLPDDTLAQTDKWAADAVAALQNAETNLNIDGQPAPPAFIVMTNYPHHYHADKISAGVAGVFAGYKIPDYGHGAIFPDLKSIYFARKKYREVEDIRKSLTGHYEIPVTFEGEIPELHFGDQKMPRLIIGKSYLIPDKDGNEVEGVLETATVLEAEKMAYGVYHVPSQGIRIIVTAPMTDEELTAYKKYPDTFFGVIHHAGHKSETPYDLFEFMMETYKHSSKEKLLEWLNARHDDAVLRSMSQEELAAIYCEGCAMQAEFERQKKSVKK